MREAKSRLVLLLIGRESGAIFFFFFNQSSSVVKQNQSKPELLSTLNAKTRAKRVFLFEMTVTIWKAYIWASD